MSDTDGLALDIARRYFDAWTAHDIDTAFGHVADDVLCDAPAGRLEGRDAFRAFMEPFSRTLLEARLIAAFGDDTTALIMYDTKTALVASGPAAELFTVVDGRIAHDRFIFDRQAFTEARAAAGS